MTWIPVAGVAKAGLGSTTLPFGSGEESFPFTLSNLSLNRNLLAPGAGSPRRASSPSPKAKYEIRHVESTATGYEPNTVNRESLWETDQMGT
jgi:hypothetical protein